MFDPATRQLSREQVVVKLTGGEINLLEALVRNAGKPLSRERCWRWRAMTMAASATTGPSTSPLAARVIETDPKQPRWIQTVWGIGYRFSP